MQTKKQKNHRPGYMNFIIPLDKFQAITQNVFIASWHAKRIFLCFVIYESSTLDDKHQLKFFLASNNTKDALFYGFFPYIFCGTQKKNGKLWGAPLKEKNTHLIHAGWKMCVLFLIMTYTAIVIVYPEESYPFLL